MGLWAERYVVKATRATGADSVLMFTFTKKEDAEEMLPIIAKTFDENISDLYVDVLRHIPSTNIEALKVTLAGVKDIRDAEKLEKKTREEYLRQNPDEYWNSSKEEFCKKPTPVWGRFGEGWWRHVTPEMFFADEDYYVDLFKELGGNIMEALMVRGTPRMVDKHKRETKRMSIYEKAIREGKSVNINSVGGYNDFDVVEIMESEDEPRTQGEGLTGILMYDGIFYPCLYGKHHKLIQTLRGKYPDEVLDTYSTLASEDIEQMIFFFSHGQSPIAPYDTISVINRQGRTLSGESLDWLRENKKYMSDVQSRRLENYVGGSNENI